MHSGVLCVGPVHFIKWEAHRATVNYIHCIIITAHMYDKVHTARGYVPYNGKIWQVLYLANEPFERDWRILIWRLRRGYYSTDVASTGKL